MSKNHVTQSNADLDAELDQFIQSRKVKPVVSRASEGINLFGGTDDGTPLKKKPLLQRLLTFLRTFTILHLQ